MGVTIYDGTIRERDMFEGLDLLSNKHDAILDRYQQGLYKNKIGTFLKDITEITNVLAPEGLDRQLSFMSNYRRPREYEVQLQNSLTALFNGNQESDTMMLLGFVMNSLHGTYSKGYVGAADNNRMQHYTFRIFELETIYKKHGMRGVILILRYYIDFWYQI